MDIPKIYQNKNITNIENSQDYYYSNLTPKKININQKINNIFKSKKYLYKIPVIINTTNNKIVTYIIGKTNTYLITINNELISIKDIIDINEKIH